MNYIRFPNHMNVLDSKRVRNVPNRPECIETYVHTYLNVRTRIKYWIVFEEKFARGHVSDIEYAILINILCLQRADVQVALGIISSDAANATYPWNQCNDVNYLYGPEPMMPLYITFMNNTNYKILVFSGTY